ncbi:hypothetical protein LTR97_007836 [Elasticomyces elasticus]|uniref:DUF7730 domain-containing protein n=1 Tax=Elasticomyces elasticus TaxID=574655 RepID=A0AAN7VPA3_9PEZI|nr:hypothetical protein LTR97_007836 [Elasticomyces elasticus]
MSASDPITTSTSLDMPQLSDPERQMSDALPTQPTENHVRTSLLMELPPELRNRIWEYTLSEGTIYVKLRSENEELSAYVVNDSGNTHANNEKADLLRSAYGLDEDGAELPIYQEAAGLFYITNRFELQAFDPETCLASNGLMDPGLFSCDGQNAAYFLLTMKYFRGAIGLANAGRITSVTFNVGQVDALDLESENEAPIIMQEVLKSLQDVHTAHPSWKLTLSMTFFIRYNDIKDESNSGSLQKVDMSVADPTTGLDLAFEELERKIVRNIVDGLYVHDDLEGLRNFSRKLHMEVLKSR